MRSRSGFGPCEFRIRNRDEKRSKRSHCIQWEPWERFNRFSSLIKKPLEFFSRLSRLVYGNIVSNSLFRLFWTVFTFSMFRDGIQSKFTRFIEGDRHWIVKRGDNVVKTYGICKNLSNPVPIPSFQKRHLFKIC